MSQPAPAANPRPTDLGDRHRERLDREHYGRHTRVALGAMCGLVLLTVAGMIVWLLLSSGPAVVANRFVQLVAGNKMDRAYVEASSIGLRQRMSLEEFETLVGRFHFAKAKKLTWTVRRQTGDRAEALGQMVLDDGAIEALNMTFVEEFDDWKVDGLVSGTPQN